MKSFSKRVASFTMAAAMVLSLAAVSPVDAQAAKKASITKKTSITAGKTYTYKIKNVTSKQYVKVTGITSGVKVKYNNKTVKKNSTKIYGKKSGAALALKVTAKDKVANYKATIKAQVYNKSNHKKVGSLLKTTTKVKCTKLAIKNVEPATLSIAGGNGHKYIVVSFNRALDSLDPSEVSIRNKATNELVAVEKVALASNGKSATLTLLGDSVATTTTYLEPNVDYVLSVDKSGVTAAMDFNFPAVKDNETVKAVNAAKRTITVGVGVGTAYTVPTTISVDFQDILGRTVTFWHNKNNEITKLVVANETVVYGAFTATAKTDGTKEFAAKTSDDKYLSTSGNPGTSSIKDTVYVKANGKGGAGNPATTTGAPVEYAKLVLNPNGTIRTAVYEQYMSGRVLVGSVAENIVTESKNKSINLKEYVIVKDGKTAEIKDLQANDVVFYNAGNKFADVYTTKVVGAVTAVTDSKVTVADKAYEYYTSPANKTYYIENNESKETNADYWLAVKKAAKDATLYLDRFGKVVYASGDKGTVATSTRDIVLTGDVETYNTALVDYIKINGSDATTTAVPAIAFGDIKTIKVKKGVVAKTYGKDVTTDTTNSNDEKYKVKSFDSIVKSTNRVDTISASLDPSGTATINVNASGMTAKLGDFATLTLDSTNSKVIGIEFEKATTTLLDDGNTSLEKGASIIKGDNGNNYQITATTPVYEINDKKEVSKVAYSEYAKKTKAAMAEKVNVFTNGGNVTKIVVDNSLGTVYDSLDSATKNGIVVERETLNSKLAIVTMISEGQEVKYTSFADGVSISFKAGDMITVTYEKSTNKVTAVDVITIAKTTVSTNTANQSDVKIVLDGKIDQNDFATSIAPTIVQKISNTEFKTINYGELSDIVAATDYTNGKYVEITYHEMAADIIDYVLVQVK